MARSEVGYVESAQRLIQGGRDWDQHQLRSAASAAELRNTGWPIGIVLTGDDGPVPTANGIEARIGRDPDRAVPDWEDFWSFSRDGSYYVARVLEEDHREPSFQTSEGHPEKPLWFDVRIWRIAEMLLHSRTLYKALGVPADELYLLSVNHFGLRGREFWTSRPRGFARRGKFCKEPEALWQHEVSQDGVRRDFDSIVEDIAKKLFVLFDFASVGGETAKITDDFLRSRL